MTGYGTSNTKLFTAVMSDALDRFLGPQDYNSHVLHYRRWKSAYGDWDGYNAAMRAKAVSRAKYGNIIVR